jgi:hypothetical protein
MRPKARKRRFEIVRAEASRARTLFLGHGVNDAPAMQAATVGVAFGAKSDITSEAADAVVLETSLSRIDELMHIGRRMRRIALEKRCGRYGTKRSGHGGGCVRISASHRGRHRAGNHRFGRGPERSPRCHSTKDSHRFLAFRNCRPKERLSTSATIE